VEDRRGRQCVRGWWSFGIGIGMSDIAETKRLAEAINSLASVIAEIITERVRRLEEATDRKLTDLPARASDPVLTKREMAVRFRVSGRTIDNWMNRGYLPYLKIGKAVRFRWSEVDRQLSDLEIGRLHWRR
jgi:excisionase family DNA binding protein